MNGCRGAVRWLGRVVMVAGLAAGGALGCRGGEPGDATLEARVVELMPDLERLSGLDAREPVRVRRQSATALRTYVEEQLRDELSAEETAGLEAAYAAFGLIPDTLDLRALLLELYSEQVVGYYDPESRALFVREDIDEAALEPVLVHELVHALQDQHADLDALVAPARGNDERTAAQAAIEGHATIVMFAYLAEKQSGDEVDPAELPDPGERMRPALEAQNRSFPVFTSAPRVIREAMLFPYLAGASFVQALWRETVGADTASRPAPLGEWLPLSTEQVMHPRERFLARRDAPTRIRFGDPGGADGAGGSAATEAGRIIYEDGLGALETSVLLDVHGADDADGIAAGWDGDRFRLWRHAGGTESLEWLSVWDSPADADAFASAYRAVLDRRPQRSGTVERIDVDGRPLVRVVDAPRSADPRRTPRSEIVGLESVEAPADSGGMTAGDTER